MFFSAGVIPETDTMSEMSEMSSKSKKRFRTNKKAKETKELSKNQKEALKAQMRLDKALAAANMDEYPSPDEKDDPSLRFAGDGVTFKAKLIGVDPVSGPRGDQMCKSAMTRLKAIVKGTGSHKQKIVLSISLDGLKLMDEKTRETISQHPIPLISYISRDASDSRAFGFVYGSPSEGHQFIGIKTEKQAIPVMQTIADLFTYVYEKRRKEKSRDKENSGKGEPVLTFNPREEVFSEQKVNAAWKQTESKTKSSNTSSPVSVPNLPPPLPPPRTESFSSRASTLNYSQKSEVMSDLRAMRQLIQSAQAAADGSERYATWESFNEDNRAAAESILTQNRNGGLTVASDGRPSSSISSHSSMSYAGRGVGNRFPTSVLPVVPSPPSSPRSVNIRARARPRRGFEQPNQVALPPPVATSSLSLQSKGITGVTQPNEPSLFQSSQASGFNSNFPTQSEPDLFSQFNQRISSNTSDKFEVNFDAVFSNTTFAPIKATTQPETSLKPTNESSSHGNYGQFTSSQQDSKSNEDRYACFQEIHNLASYPSIFDQPSSSSDSDTFVGSPPSVSPAKISHPKDNPENQDLFGATSWSTSTTQPIMTVGHAHIPPSGHDELSQQNIIAHPTSLIDLNRKASTKSSDVPYQMSQTKLVDTATSPGTPPDSSQLKSQRSKDAFSMATLLQGMEPERSRNDITSKRGSSEKTNDFMTSRVCEESLETLRGTSPASSVASSHSRNPFAPEERQLRDFDDRSSPGVKSSLPSRPSPQPPKVGGYPYFDPYSCHSGHSAFDASQFPRHPSQYMCHHYHGMPAAMPPSMYPGHPHECPPYMPGFYYHPEIYQHDMRFQYKQNPMFFSQQVYSSVQAKKAHDFDLRNDLDSKGETNSQASHQRQQDLESNRSLSPNNPFSPVYFPIDEHGEASAPPPRPPARSDGRRFSQESETPPPPLPKRRTANAMGPHPIPMGIGPFYPYGHPAMYAYPPVLQPTALNDAPAIPLPSRKKSLSRPVERRTSIEAPIAEDPFDPFNVSYVDRELNRLSTMKRQTSLDVPKTSTPLNSSTQPPSNLMSTETNPSTIHSISESNPNNQTTSGYDSVFDSCNTSGDNGSFSRMNDQFEITKQSKSDVEELSLNHLGEVPASNREKDPFDDDFFQTT